MKSIKIKNYDFFIIKNNFAKFFNIKSTLKYGRDVPNPMVSITIPTYQRPELLKDAIQSVLKQKNFDNFELVIVDNDSTGLYSKQIIDYLRLIDDKRIRYYVNEKNIGVFGNWNRCIELANGTWMTILSDDDILFEEYLSELVSIIKANPLIDRVECKHVVSININDRLPEKKFVLRQKIINFLFGKTKPISYDMYLYGCFSSSHVQLYKKQYALEIGGFNNEFNPISDYVFNTLYLYKHPNAIQLNKYLCGVRLFCNTSLKRITQIGMLKWNIRFRQFLLEKNKTFFRTLYVYFFRFHEINLVLNESNLINKLKERVLHYTLRIIRLFLNTAR